MIRFALTLTTALGFAAVAPAQQPGGYPQNPYNQNPYPSYPSVQPNVYNPANQPLSPYLNLLRGGNQGVNYYYGVRPGTVGGGGLGGTGAISQGGGRFAFFPPPPPLDNLDLPAGATPNSLPPAGHPVLYNNTLGYYPGGPGQRGLNGRPTGIGGGPTPARTK